MGDRAPQTCNIGRKSHQFEIKDTTDIIFVDSAVETEYIAFYEMSKRLCLKILLNQSNSTNTLKIQCAYFVRIKVL